MFTDENVNNNAEPDSDDPGRSPAAPPPLSPEEYEKEKQEARNNE